MVSSSDGNIHDKDDIGASAVSIAFIAAFKNKYVHQITHATLAKPAATTDK